jgi:hypothetical protein
MLYFGTVAYLSFVAQIMPYCPGPGIPFFISLVGIREDMEYFGADLWAEILCMLIGFSAILAAWVDYSLATSTMILPR